MPEPWLPEESWVLRKKPDQRCVRRGDANGNVVFSEPWERRRWSQLSFEAGGKHRPLNATKIRQLLEVRRPCVGVACAILGMRGRRGPRAQGRGVRVMVTCRSGAIVRFQPADALCETPPPPTTPDAESSDIILLRGGVLGAQATEQPARPESPPRYVPCILRMASLRPCLDR